jgi:hypothetical protein
MYLFQFLKLHYIYLDFLLKQSILLQKNIYLSLINFWIASGFAFAKDDELHTLRHCEGEA